MFLFKSGVAWQADSFHTVQEWWRNCIKTVRCCDEKDFAQIDRNVDIMICEGVILFWVKNFKHSSRRITMKVRSAIEQVSYTEFRKITSITDPTLSISSRRNTGFATPTFLRPFTIRPGIAAT